jgi:hypothetical protein
MSTQPELIRFTEFPVGQQAEMRATVDKQLGVERTWVDAAWIITDASSLCDRLTDFDEVRPRMDIDHFGVVSPIRGRFPRRDDPVEDQSYPYVTTDTRDFILELTDKLYEAVMDERGQFEVDDFAFSITSLLRTVEYQRLIVRNGQLALDPDQDQNSSHSTGRAFDLDHAGGYVYLGGQWTPANPNRNFELWRPIREVMRDIFPVVVSTMVDHNVIDEVPNGWGTYHVAVKPPV